MVPCHGEEISLVPRVGDDWAGEEDESTVDGTPRILLIRCSPCSSIFLLRASALIWTAVGAISAEGPGASMVAGHVVVLLIMLERKV